jgi:hypothetical protein
MFIECLPTTKRLTATDIAHIFKVTVIKNNNIISGGYFNCLFRVTYI